MTDSSNTGSARRQADGTPSPYLESVCTLARLLDIDVSSSVWRVRAERVTYGRKCADHYIRGQVWKNSSSSH
jgi:hypothetical protein